MTPQEIEQIVALEVARQLTTILPKIKSDIAGAIENVVKPLQSDVLQLANDMRQTRHTLSAGSVSLHSEPTAEDLRDYLPVKLTQHSLQEVVREEAANRGVNIDNPHEWAVYSGLPQPSAHQLARKK